MRKLILVAAMLAATSAGAVHISQDTGQVLVSPFYTVQNGQETLLSIVNTTAKTKAIKVRFLEAVNSRDVLDFNLYMSPFDVWTAKLTSDEVTGGAKIITRDQSCTVPMIPADGEPFRKLAYDGTHPDYPLDGGDTSYRRLREGHFEIIEMGIADVNNLGDWDHTGNGIADSTHVNGVPESCNTFQENWTRPSGGWDSLDNDTLAPTGGLFGSVAIIDVQVGTEFSVPYTVLNRFSAEPIHYRPGTLAPDLRHANPAVSAVRDETGELFIDNWTTGIEAVSALLMADRVFQEYSVNHAVEAETSWVVSFPTKHEHVDLDVALLPPFTEKFANGKSCDRTAQLVWDREETVVIGDDGDFSPMPPADTTELCYETNILNFGTSDTLSAGQTSQSFQTPFNNGWAMIGFRDFNHKMVSNNGTAHYGLPVIGFKATKLGNSNVGIGASYAVSDGFKYARRIISGSGR